jgi:hypothetical protein
VSVGGCCRGGRGEVVLLFPEGVFMLLLASRRRSIERLDYGL